MEDPEVEGVYIAVTADKHAELMKMCIKNHKPILCEKTFTVNQKEAEEIFELAEKEGVFVAEAMWTWHNIPALKVKEWLESGKIGDVRKVNASYAWPMLRFNKNPRLTTNEMIGGALMDIWIYAVTYAYHLFGKPEKLTCAGLVFDTANFMAAEKDFDIMADYRLLKEYIRRVHVKNVVRGNFPSGELCCNGEKIRCVPTGTGIVDLASVISALKNDGYDGAWSMEYAAAKGVHGLKHAEALAEYVRCFEKMYSAS